MDQNDPIYIELQRHLDRQAVGFPATKSGAEIKILKHIFSPREAEIATCLTYKFEPLEKIFQRAGHLVESLEVLEEELDRIIEKGGIEVKTKEGKKFYCNAPFVVGMYEYQVGKLTPEFISDVEEFTSDKKFGIEFLSTKLPQMRTIPVLRSIKPQHNVNTYDEITRLMKLANPPFCILECICRQKKALQNEPCQVTDRKETCMAIDNMAEAALRSGLGREITLDEALSILEQNQKDGLVLQPSNTQKAEFICSCCGCCCGLLTMQKMLPKPVDFWAANFYAVVDTETCNGCGNCEKRCQVGAAKLSQKKKTSSIELNRCVGCGLCVSTCPAKAISLRKKQTELIPPETRENLFDIIMANKKGKFGKLKLTGKLILDGMLTGLKQLVK